MNKTLFIKSALNGTASVYNASGTLIDLLSVSENEIISTVLPQGFYIVKIGNNTYKVLIN